MADNPPLSQSEQRRDEVEAALGHVIDPELGIDIVSLGLIYGIGIENDVVYVLMTLTTPGCPMHGTISADVERTLRRLPWAGEVKVHITHTPPWTPELLKPNARTLLGR